MSTAGLFITTRTSYPTAIFTIVFILSFFLCLDKSYATPSSNRSVLHQRKSSFFISYLRNKASIYRSNAISTFNRIGNFRNYPKISSLRLFKSTSNSQTNFLSTLSDHQTTSSMFAQVNLSQCMTLYLLPSLADTPANKQRFKLDFQVRKAILPHFYKNKGPCRRVVHADALQLFGRCFEIDIHVGNQTDFEKCRSASNYRRCVWHVGNILTNTILTVPVPQGRPRVKQGDKTTIRLFDKPKCKIPETMATLTVEKQAPWSGGGNPTKRSPSSSPKPVRPSKPSRTPSPSPKPKPNMVKPSKSSSPSAKPKHQNNNPSSSSFAISSCVRLRAVASSVSSARVILIRSMLQDNDSDCKPLIYTKSVRVRGACAVFTESIACGAKSVSQWRQCVTMRPISAIVSLFDKSATFKAGQKNFIGLYSDRMCSQGSKIVEGELPLLSATYDG